MSEVHIDPSDPIAERVRTDRYLRSLFRLGHNIFEQGIPPAKSSTARALNPQLPNILQDSVTSRRAILTDASAVRQFSTRRLPSGFGPIKPKQARGNQPVEQSRDKSSYFLPFYESLAEDKSVRMNVAASLEHEVSKPILIKPKGPNGLERQQTINFSQEQIPKQVSSTADLPPAQKNPGKKTQPRLPKLAAHKSNMSKAQLTSIFSALASEITTNPDYLAEKAEELQGDDSDFSQLPFPREFIEDQLKHSLQDLEKYKADLKTHITGIHSSLSEQIKKSDKMSKIFEQYTIKIPKLKRFVLGKSGLITEEFAADHAVGGRAEEDGIISAKKVYKCQMQRFDINSFFPPSRAGGVLVKYGDENGSTVLFGGGVGSDILTDFYTLDLENMAWKPLVLSADLGRAHAWRQSRLHVPAAQRRAVRRRGRQRPQLGRPLEVLRRHVRASVA